MIPITSLVSWVTALVVGTFGIIIYLGNRQSSTRIYAILSFFVQLWAIGVGAYFYAESPFWIVFWNQYNHFAAGFIAATYYIFSLVYPTEAKVSRRAIAIVVVVETILFYLYFFTDIAIHDSSFLSATSVDRYEIYYQVGPIFYMAFIAFFGRALYNLKGSLDTTEGEARTQVKRILFGTILGFIPPVMAQIVFPRLGYYGLYWLGPTLALGWVTFTLYAIARHRTLNIRLVFAEVSVLVLSVILFANIFISEDLSFGTIGRVVIFFAFAIVGGFFIRNIITKEEQKEKLTALANELKGLNSTLENEVAGRTDELTGQKLHTETIIENLSNGLIEYDREFRVIRLNTAAEKMLGVERGRVLGTKIFPQGGSRELEAITKATYPAGTTDAFPREVNTHEIIVSYPREHEFQIVTAPLNEGNKAIGYIKVIRDITHEKQISREKSEFISIAAHQLRTPLSAIKWNFGVILAGDKGILPEAQKKPLLRANETNEKMIDLVNDLLNVARIEDGRFGYSFDTHNPIEVIEKAIADSAVSPKENPPELLFERPTGYIPPIFCDAEKLSLAIHNVIENALHYTNSTGKVTVSMSTDQESLMIDIRDTGIGISKKDIPRLFSKFFRSEGAKKLRSDGTGLGLYIVRNIITRHGGMITVQSVENEGSTFSIRLPLNAASISEADETVYY